MAVVYPLSTRSLRFIPLDDSTNFEVQSSVSFSEKKMGELTQKELGALGERIALCFLETRGFTYIEHNVHFRFGEVDLLGYDEPTWVLCEVKSRLVKDPFHEPIPELAITGKKIHTYRRLAKYYYSYFPYVDSVRFDVVSVNVVSEYRARLRYLASAEDLEVAEWVR